MNRIFVVLFLGSFECLHARGPPTLLPHTPNLIELEVKENEPLALHCPVMVTPDLSVQWSKNNEELDPMWSTSNLVIRRFLLKIPHAHSSDAGLYKCNVVNGFGYVQAQFHVNVKSNGTTVNSMVNNEEQNIGGWEIDSINGEAPEFLTRSEGIQTNFTKVIQPEGTTVQLKCLASGKPTPEIRWKKNGKILSEDEYGITQSQILTIKDLRRSDTGNYTCELFNSFGTINATYLLTVTEKLQFFGDHPENSTVQIGGSVVLHCRVQTHDPTDAVVFGSEQYENIEHSQQAQYSNNILSKSLLFPQVNLGESGEYICLIQNEKATNYRKAFINILVDRQGNVTLTNHNNILLYVIVIPLFVLGFILFIIFCLRRHQHRKDSHYPDRLKAPMKPRQALSQPIPSTNSRTSNDYLADSVDSIPVSRQYQQQRYGPSTSSDLASLTSSNLYYARIQAI